MTIPSWEGPETLVASGTITAQFFPEIAALQGGGFVVVWAGAATPGAANPDGGNSVSFRIYDADRAPVSAALPAGLDQAGQLAEPLVAATDDGGFVIAWMQGPASGLPETRRAPRFDAEGAAVGAQVEIAAMSGDDRAGLVGLVGLADGRAAVIWGDSPSDAPNATRATILDADGAVEVDGKALLSSNIHADNENFGFATAGGGFGFLATTGFPRVVDLRLFDEDGEPAGTSRLGEAGENETGLMVTALADGRIVAVTGRHDGGEQVLTVHILDAGGTPLSEIPLPPIGAAVQAVELTPTADDGFLLVLNTFGVGDATDIEAMKFDASGALEGRFDIARTETGAQQDPDGALLADGDVVFAWRHAVSGFSTPEIRLQAFDPSGLTAGNAPTDIVLTGDPVKPGVAGQTIGRLSAVDADPDEVHSFEFTSVSSVFEIEGDVLRYAPTVSPVEAYHGTVEIRVTDAQSNIYVETIEIAFETTEPEPEGVTRIGTRRNDKLAGKAGDDLLKGLGGKDRLLGKDGDDDLQGGGGRDLLKGQGGDDRLDGGKGRDKLIGGGGADVFVLDGKGGPDRVLDHAVGRDRIEIASGAESFGDLTLVRKGDDVLIRDGRTKLAILDDVSKADIDASDFLFS